MNVKIRKREIGGRTSRRERGDLTVEVEEGAAIVRRYGGAILDGLECVFGWGTVAGLGEGTLLDRFVTDRDEAAFAALVARHGPMVLGVCRRALRDGHDVEDAFQATFLVLARRAGSIRDGDRVGPWLHGVAHRVAVRARADVARRRAREPVGADPDRAEAPPSGGAPPDLRAVLDEELARLPESLRAPLVLCYLEGLTHEEAAGRLRWPVGTVRSRMARARDLLRGRLARRGLAAHGAGLAAALVADPVSAALLDSTVGACLIFVADRAASAASASAGAAALAQGVLNAMTIAKLKALGIAALAGTLALGSAPTLARQFGGAGRAPDAKDDLARSVAKLQAELDESNRRNDQLQKDLQAVKDELDLRKAAPTAGGGPAAAKPSSAPAIGRGSSAGSGTPKASSPMMPGMGMMPGAMGMAGTGGGPGMGGMGGPGMMPGMYGGMGMGGTGVPQKMPNYVMGNQIIVTTPTGDDQVTGYSLETGKPETIRLFPEGGPRRRAIPVVSSSVAAYDLTGPEITRLAVFCGDDGHWHTQDLREPTDRATPVVGPSLVGYGIGRRIYAFSAVAKRWDVLELPEGTKPVFSLGFQWITHEADGHLHVFGAKTGKWADIDLRGKAGAGGESAPKALER